MKFNTYLFVLITLIVFSHSHLAHADDACLLTPVPSELLANVIDTDEQYLYRGHESSLYIQDALTLEVVGLIEFGFHISRIHVAGDRAYLIVGIQLVVLDISDPTAMSVLGEFGTFLGPLIETIGTQVLISRGGFVQVLDAADPSAISVIGEIELPSEPFIWELVGTTLYVMDRIEIMYVIDVSDPVHPVNRQKFILDRIEYRWPVALEEMNGTLAIGFADSDNIGYMILDISRPFVPTVIQQDILDVAIVKIGSREQLAVVYTSNDLVYFADVSDPENPVVLHTLDSSEWRPTRHGDDQIRFSNNRVFIRQTREDALYVLSISGCMGWCNRVDQATPAGVLNFDDVKSFLDNYTNQSSVADFAAPFGRLDFFDISAFLSQFQGGCP